MRVIAGVAWRLALACSENLLANIRLAVGAVWSHGTNLAIMSTASVLTNDRVQLRPLKNRDWVELEQLLLSNRAWLKPWEATNPEGPTSLDAKGMVKSLVRQAREGSSVSFVILVDGATSGLINVANIVFGSLSSAIIGYWVSESVAGQGVTPTAVALTCDFLFDQLHLHRVEIAIRPENRASLRVVQKLGFRFEGLKERYIHINYAWRDHFIFALTKEDVPHGVLHRWKAGLAPETVIPET